MLNLPNVTDLPSAQALIAQLYAVALAQGLDLGAALRPPPPEPTTCCGRGCNGCVWEGFYAALDGWRVDALDLLDTVDGPMLRTNLSRSSLHQHPPCSQHLDSELVQRSSS